MANFHDQAVDDAGRPVPGESIEQKVLQSHIATILERGRAIVPALRAYAAELPAGIERSQLTSVCEILETGNPSVAAQALSEWPDAWIPLLSAASSSPDPGKVLHDFLQESRHADELRRQWWVALAYPVVLIGLTTVVMTLLALFVTPEFRDIFDDFDLRLPGLTRLVLSVAQFLSGWGLVIIAALAGLLVVIVFAGNRWLPQRALSWVPGVRLPSARRSSVARLARFLGDLLDAGVSIPDALRIAGFTVGNPRMQGAAWQLANDIESTGSFSRRAYERPLSSAVAYALASNLTTESRVRLLREISNSHADRLRINLSWASGVIEPAAIALVGLAVGITVIGLFLPLVRLVEGLTK